MLARAVSNAAQMVGRAHAGGADVAQAAVVAKGLRALRSSDRSTRARRQAGSQQQKAKSGTFGLPACGRGAAVAASSAPARALAGGGRTCTRVRAQLASQVLRRPRLSVIREAATAPGREMYQRVRERTLGVAAGTPRVCPCGARRFLPGRWLRLRTSADVHEVAPAVHAGDGRARPQAGSARTRYPDRHAPPASR